MGVREVGRIRRWFSLWDAERKIKWRVNLALSPVFAFFLIKLLSAFGLFQCADMHTSLTDWRLGAVGLVERPEQPVLLISMANAPPGWGIAYERLVALDPEDGATLGQVIKGGHTTLLGLNEDQAWIAHRHGDNTTYEGFALPDLDLRYDLDDLLDDHPRLAEVFDEAVTDGPQLDLRIIGLDGYQYRLTPSSNRVEKLPLDPPPVAPDLLDGWKGCSNKYRGPLIDHRGCKPVEVDGRALTIRSVTQGQTYHWHIARTAADGAQMWEVSDRQLFGPLGADDPLRYIDFVTLHRGKLLIVAEDGGDGDDVYAAAIDATAGRIVWTRVFW